MKHPQSFDLVHEKFVFFEKEFELNPFYFGEKMHSEKVVLFFENLEISEKIVHVKHQN